MTDPLVGSLLAGRYRIETMLSEGGMGRIYRGVHTMLDRPVAVKCIHPHLVTTDAIVDRFMAEAKVASRLSHPNIVEIYDFGRAEVGGGTLFFLVMELLDGRDLSDVLMAAPMAFPRAVDILRQALGGLEEAHDAGVAHRDIKPENLFVSTTKSGKDRIKIIDFGIAKTAGSRKLTQAGALVGSPSFMPPEQISEGVSDVNADLYAAGAILFEMLTGQRLFDHENPVTILSRQLYEERPDPRAVAPHRQIPASLAEICLKAIQKSREARFQTAEEFSEALAGALAAPAAAPSVGPRQKLVSEVRVGEGEAPPRTVAGVLLGSTPVSSPLPPERSGAPTISSAPPPVGSAPPPTYGAAPTISSAVPPPSSVAPVSSAFPADEPVDLLTLHELEAGAAAAFQAGDREGAERQLSRGVAAGRKLFTDGDLEMGGTAWSTFGRRLAELLREDKRFGKARGILQELLDQPGISERAQVLALEQLVLVHHAAGMPDEADAARKQALSIAKRLDDPTLVARIRELRRQISGGAEPSSVAPGRQRSALWSRSDVDESKKAR